MANNEKDLRNQGNKTNQQQSNSGGASSGRSEDQNRRSSDVEKDLTARGGRTPDSSRGTDRDLSNDELTDSEEEPSSLENKNRVKGTSENSPRGSSADSGSKRSEGDRNRNKS